MTIQDIKIILDDFVANGGDVNELKYTDHLYQRIQNAKIYDGDRKLTVNEKFILAGHKRNNDLTPIEKVKKLLDEFSNNGGNVFEIHKGMPIYEKIKNIVVILENGRRATMLEKFQLSGYNKRIRRPKTISEIKAMLDAFVATGGDINDLGSKDELYIMVKAIDQKLSIYEKFALCGYTRIPKKLKNAIDSLYAEVKLYVDGGGSFHIPRKHLPFFNTLKSANRTLSRKYGRTVSSQETLESIGFPGYSDLYFNSMCLFDLQKYQDEYGFVDSYRKDQNFSKIIERYARSLDMPASLVIQLIAGQKLEKSFFKTEFLKYVSSALLEYKKAYGTFENISRNDSQLYNRISRIKRTIQTENGKPISTKEFIIMLGLDDTANTFKDEAKIREPDFEEDILPLIKEAQQHHSSISANNIPDDLYRMILDYAKRNGTTIQKLFEGVGIKYTSYKLNNNGGIIIVDKFPFIDEMKKERDLLYSEFIKNNPNMIKETLLENYIKICKIVYNKYKNKIENFGKSNELDFSEFPQYQ